MNLAARIGRLHWHCQVERVDVTSNGVGAAIGMMAIDTNDGASEQVSVSSPPHSPSRMARADPRPIHPLHHHAATRAGCRSLCTSEDGGGGALPFLYPPPPQLDSLHMMEADSLRLWPSR